MASQNDELPEEATLRSRRLSLALRRTGGRITKNSARFLGSNSRVFLDQNVRTNFTTFAHRRRLICNRISLGDFLGPFSAHKLVSGSTNCRKCGVLLGLKNCGFCNGCLNIQEGDIVGLPKNFVMWHCQGCNSYSFTGRAGFFHAPLQSTAMLDFLLRRLDIYLFRLQLDLMDASFMPTESGSNNMRVGLLLEQEPVDGVKVTKRHVVDYLVTQQACIICSHQSIASQWTVVVQLRQRINDRRSITNLMLRIGRHEHTAIKFCKRVSGGLDVYFATDDDAMVYFNLLRSRLPVRPNGLTKCGSDGSYISAELCPIIPDDLIYIRCKKILAALGFSGPLVICTHVTNSISLLDPLKLTQATLTGDQYWSEVTAFQVLDISRYLVEYIVLNVQIISKEVEYSLADVEVVRVADFGKHENVFTTRTHLGYMLKPGDHALGYDFYDLKNGNGDMMVTDEFRESLPDVVLLKKKYTATRPIRRKNTSPEYDEFLRDLEKNPEAMFSLSLTSEKKTENQQPGMASAKTGESSDFDLEGLLADLVLGDQQAVDNPGCSN